MSSYQVEPVAVTPDFASDPGGWLIAQAQARGLRYLLAHCDDGVIWGRIDGAQLATSHEIDFAVSPLLREQTLQQCRLFGPKGELFLWRNAEQWQARWLADGEGEVVDEAQILWGSEVVAQQNDFTLLVEGEQGMRHIVPLAVTAQQARDRRLRLLVRHYVLYNDSGEARLSASRLVDLVIAAA